MPATYPQTIIWAIVAAKSWYMLIFEINVLFFVLVSTNIIGTWSKWDWHTYGHKNCNCSHKHVEMHTETQAFRWNIASMVVGGCNHRVLRALELAWWTFDFLLCEGCSIRTGLFVKVDQYWIKIAKAQSISAVFYDDGIFLSNCSFWFNRPQVQALGVVSWYSCQVIWSIAHNLQCFHHMCLPDLCWLL